MTETRAKEVLYNGDIVESWLCDYNVKGELEINAGEEFLMDYQNHYYLIVVENGHNDHRTAPICLDGYSCVIPARTEQGFIKDLILKHKYRKGII